MEIGTKSLAEIRHIAMAHAKVSGAYETIPGEPPCFSWVRVHKHKYQEKPERWVLGIILGKTVRHDGYEFYVVLDVEGEQNLQSRCRFVIVDPDEIFIPAEVSLDDDFSMTLKNALNQIVLTDNSDDDNSDDDVSNAFVPSLV